MRTWGKTVTTIAAAGLVLSGCSLPFTDAKESGKVTESERSSGEGSGDANSEESEPVSVTVASSGDILVHVPVRQSAEQLAKSSGTSRTYDFDPMFAGVKKQISEPDVAICHQETPISATNDDLSPPGSLIYNVPHEIAPAMKRAGFDGCDTASNHVWDRTAKGVTTTRKQLKKAGLKVAGPTLDAKDPGMPAMYEAKGVKIANLAYSYTILNQSSPNTKTPPGQENLGRYLWPKIGAKGIIADAKKAKKAGADLVVLNMHWGGEYVVEPSKEQTDLAKKLAASPYIDGIFGAHAHLIQPCSTIKGKTVFYGLGNFLSNQGPGTMGTLDEYNADGAIAKYTFERDDKGTWSQRASYQPTMVDGKKQHRITASTPESNPESFKRTKTRMNKLGDCKATATGDGE